MGVVEKILKGDQEALKEASSPKKINNSDRKTSKTEEGQEETPEKPEKPEVGKIEKKENLRTEDLIPSGVQMFVKLEDYRELATQLNQLQKVINRLEGLERMHRELQDVHGRFMGKLKTALSDAEDVRENISRNLKIEER